MNNDVTCNHRKNASTPTKKLVWSCNNQELLRSTLVNHFCKYNDLITRLCSDNISVYEVVENCSKYLFDDAFCHFGKTIIFDSDNLPKIPNMSNPWFDCTCKTAKQNFNRAKYAYSRCRSNETRVNLTRCRTSLNKGKRRTQAVYKFEKGKRIQSGAKANLKQFWKEIKTLLVKNRKRQNILLLMTLFYHFSNVFYTHPAENIGENHDETLDNPFSEEET